MTGVATLAGLVVVTGVLVVVCGALVEVFRQLADLRRALDLDDQPLPLQLPTGQLHLSDHGFPPSLAAAPELAVIFLSARCTTCLAIANAFRGGAPDSIWFVLESDDPSVPSVRVALESSGTRVINDERGAIARSMGIDVTPSVLTVRYGEVIRGQAVSSPRQVMSLVPVVQPSNGQPTSLALERHHPSTRSGAAHGT